MKKLVFILLLLIPAAVYAQYDYSRSSLPKEKSQLTAGDYLIKSANAQYAAIALGVASTFIAYQSNKIRLDGNTTDANVYLIGAVGCGLGAITSSFMAIHFKKQAGLKLNANTSLNAYVNSSGVIIALKF